MAFRAELDDFAGFYAESYPMAYRLALGVMNSPAAAEDVVQDAYVAAYRRRSGFRGDVPAAAWLHRIVLNAALSALRRKRLAVRSTGVAPEARGIGDGLDLDLSDALAAIDARSRAAIVLRYFHGYDYATLAGILGTTPGNVGMILSRALRRLRDELTMPDARGGTR